MLAASRSSSLKSMFFLLLDATIVLLVVFVTQLGSSNCAQCVCWSSLDLADGLDEFDRVLPGRARGSRRKSHPQPTTSEVIGRFVTVGLIIEKERSVHDLEMEYT